MESNTDEWLKGIWGNGATDVYAVGENGTILRYDGSTWSNMESWTMEHLYAVWGNSDMDIYSVGATGTILHYDGSTWTSMESGTIENLRGVWGSSETDIFAVGDNGTILHYDGSIWSFMNSETTAWLLGLWGSSGADVFATGGNYDATKGWWDASSWDGGTILHYDGDSWSEMPNEAPSQILGVWGSSGNNVFAVGNEGIILRYVSDNDPCVFERIYGGHSEKVGTLRCFRDNILSRTPIGQEIIRLYYQWSPAIVRAMEGNNEFKQEIKEMIDPVLPLIREEIE